MRVLSSFLLSIHLALSFGRRAASEKISIVTPATIPNNPSPSCAAGPKQQIIDQIVDRIISAPQKAVKYGPPVARRFDADFAQRTNEA